MLFQVKRMATNDSQEKLGLELASAVSRLEKVYKVNVNMEHTIYICCTYCYTVPFVYIIHMTHANFSSIHL
jgi:hypothetical protein